MEMHPRNPENHEPWYWWDADIKYIPIFGCQIKKSEWVTPEAKSMSLGQTMFLHMMKGFTYLFIIFFCLNLPLMFFYANGAGPIAKTRT
jgi:hypothetical protein